MAIYHMQAKVVSRGSGRSAVAASAYMSCSRMYNDYDGIQHDYTRKHGLIYQEVLLPPMASPEWKDREQLWNAVEAAEKTKDSRLAREFVVALPVELDKDSNISLLKDFIQKNFVDMGMCADFAIHDTDGHNPHAHILLTVRPLNENGTWQYKTEKEYLCIKNGEEKGFTATEFKAAQKDGWEKQYRYKVGKKKVYMTASVAQEKGYAEKDPTADVEGHDACRKVCILASLAFGKHVYPNQVETEGITNITLEDVSYIENAGGVIKLLGQIKYINDNEIAAFVSPAVVYNGSQLASVKDVFNAILVRGDAVGDVCFYGPGAGKLPTASAVVADIIDCAKHSDRKKIFGWGAGNEDYVVDYKERIEMPFYVRAKATPAEINAKFSDVKFLSRKGQPSDEVAFITDIMTENKLNKKLDGINVINTIKVTNY